MKFLLLLLLAVPTFAQIETKYDKFKDATLVSFHDGYINGKGGPARVRFWAYYTVNKDLTRHYLMFAVARDRLYFNVDRDLIFLVDDKRMELGRGSYDLDHRKYVPGLEEKVIYQITKEQMAEIAQGKLVAFQLGKFEAELSEKQKKGMKELLVHPK